MAKLVFATLLLTSFFIGKIHSAVFKFDQHEFNVVRHDKWTQKQLTKKENIKTGNCGYKGCDLGRPDRLNVHLVPHTHDDVGWLKTVDQYYYGSHSEIQEASVQYILDTVVTSLLEDEHRRFIYVEIAFFNRWWDEQSEDRQNEVRTLVNEGRLEFILGGWCMNDEAATHYNAIIDQHTVGFRFLREEFGDCATPHIGWQIDPFGHSREQASLFAQFGFDGLFFGRLDYQDKAKRLKDKTMESMWMASQNLGDASTLFTGVNFNGYGPPSGFCFQCGDAPIMDDPRLEDYNVMERVKQFVKAAKEQAGNYTTNHIMMTMGSDFQYENAHKNFKNLDKLIKHVNDLEGEKSKIHLLYSTPGCYLYALNQANQTYTQKTDDFFPYASEAFSFWTGYFTSRPALKGYVRQCNNFLQTCKQLDILGQLDTGFDAGQKIEVFKRAVGVAQHHDAVTGTEKQPVANDYARRLAEGEQQCQDVVNEALGKLIGRTSRAPVQNFCKLNISRCDVTEQSKAFTVVVYNPVARPSSTYLRVPVGAGKYTVQDDGMNPVSSQLVPLPASTKNLPAHNGSAAVNELIFAATEVPGLGMSTFFVHQDLEEEIKVVTVPAVDGGDITIGNEKLTVTFDGSSGMMKTLQNKHSGISIALQQSLKWYKSHAGNNTKDILRASGAYIFRPDGNTPKDLPASIVRVTRGSEVEEVEQKFGDFASQVVRIYKGQTANVEVEWTVGPIPYKDNIGKEIISRFDSDLATEGLFYTDSNGREILERKRNFRPTWKLNQTEKVAGNYYPVNSRIFIRDKSRNVQLTVLTDRSQGGSSIEDGSIELMVHRRMFYDDALGVGEPLNETGISGKGLVVRGKHYLILESIESSAALHRDMAERLYMGPTVTFAPLVQTPPQYIQEFNTKLSGLKRWLPDNVHLLTLERWSKDSYLLRLEHFYEKNEDAVRSKPASVSLKALFTPFDVITATELTLGANRNLDSARRLQWNVQNYGTTKADMSSYVNPLDSDLNVELQPMQIRTFEVKVRQQ